MCLVYLSKERGLGSRYGGLIQLHVFSMQSVGDEKVMSLCSKENFCYNSGEDGADKRKVWIVARQHPGESMAEWFMEGSFPNVESAKVLN